MLFSIAIAIRSRGRSPVQARRPAQPVSGSTEPLPPRGGGPRRGHPTTRSEGRGPAPRAGVVLLLGALVAAPAAAQTWMEAGDAGSFPHGAPQITRGPTLSAIEGALGGGDDVHDAFCLRVVDPGAFLATTDPNTHPDAGGAFDTRLVLFRRDGAPVLGNEDTPPSAPPFLSTLTGVATDGSGYVLTQPDDYVLVVTGFQHDPADGDGTDLFDFASDWGAVHAPDPAAGRFDHWQPATPVTGSYTVVLAGVTPCQNRLDVAFGAHLEENRICRGDGDGAFACAEISADVRDTPGLAAGFVDGDAHLDLVMANGYTRNQLCLGDGLGGFACSDLDDDPTATLGVALGYVDGDAHLDAVLANFSNENLICLGDGLGSFTCSDLLDAPAHDTGVALGYVDGDAHLDAVFTRSLAANRLCLGDGSGGFACSDVSNDANDTRAVALGYVDGDGHLDAVFANLYAFPRVCLGDGDGGFACDDIGNDFNETLEVALGYVDGDAHLDAVFANFSDDANRVCLGDGGGGFACSPVELLGSGSGDVALGYVDGDAHLDAVFARYPGANRLCLGDGTGGFGCTPVDSNEDTESLALAEFDGPTIFEDGFESGDVSAWSAVVGGP